MCRKLLFYISGLLWTIRILLITFCLEHPDTLPAKLGANRLGKVLKSKFFIWCDFANGNLMWNWAWPKPHNSAEFRFNHVLHIMWELLAKNRGHSIATLWISFTQMLRCGHRAKYQIKAAISNKCALAVHARRAMLQSGLSTQHLPFRKIFL